MSDLLTDQLGSGPRDVVDVGGGTGGLARRLAEQGHRLTVVDPSPDALASLASRTKEAGLADRITGVQGDAGDLLAVLEPSSADIVICHRTLEFVDDRLAALKAIHAVLRPAGALSLLVAQRPAAVVAQAVAGHVEQARLSLSDRLRFDYEEVVDLVGRAGFSIQESHGVGSVADQVPESVVASGSGLFDSLLALEAQISRQPAFRAMAPVLLLHARPTS